MGRAVKHRNLQRAFTLLELIAATALTVLVAGSTVAIMRSTTSARQQANRQMPVQQEARSAVRAIATALRNACRSEGETALEGAQDWLDDMPADRARFFTISRTNVRQGRPESDVKECEFYLARPENEPAAMLMRRLDPTRNQAPDGGGVVETLARNILALELSYHDGRQWRADWSADQKSWPLAVQIRLTAVDPSDRSKLWTIGRVVNFPYVPAAKEGGENEAR